MDNLPIDIQCTKLLDWVLDRRLSPRDWQKSILAVRNKISIAIQDMPEHKDITELLTGTTIHYFNCQKIIEILKETEKNSKNIFGMYSSQRMKDWNGVISLYQKNNIYLAEACSLLQRQVTYEIPALKKQISKAQQMQDDCEAKFVSTTKTINEVNHQTKKLIEEIGIKGDNIAAELKELPTLLTPIFEKITDDCKKLDKALDYYTQFVEHFCNKTEADSMPNLRYFLMKGNTSVYEWRTGTAPTKIEKTPIKYDFGEEEQAKVVKNDEINFDVDNIVLDEGGAIDWGDFDAQAVVTDENIDLNANIDDLKNVISIEESGVYVPSDGVAKDTDALSLLEYKETRVLINCSLLQLEAFFKRRLDEMSDTGNILLVTIMQDAPKTIQIASEKDIKKYLDAISDIVNYMNTKRVNKLLLAFDSPRYLKRIYEQFVQKEKSIERYLKNQEDLKVKQKEFAVEEAKLNVALKQQIDKAKQLQKQISEDLSKKYNGRRVNIMGELNTF